MIRIFPVRWTLFASMLALGILAIACRKSKKDDPTPLESLPAITQNGANTFGCLVNGQPMRAQDMCSRFSCPPNPRCDVTYGFNLAGKMDTTSSAGGYRYHIVLSFEDIRRPGTYSLDTLVSKTDNTPSRPNQVSIIKNFPPRYAVYSSDSGTYCRGELVISKWTGGQGGFAAGTFWFDLYNPAEFSDTVRVREGRFDIPF